MDGIGKTAVEMLPCENYRIEFQFANRIDLIEALQKRAQKSLGGETHRGEVSKSETELSVPSSPRRPICKSYFQNLEVLKFWLSR